VVNKELKEYGEKSLESTLDLIGENRGKPHYSDFSMILNRRSD
jgi:hypothetical protein